VNFKVTTTFVTEQVLFFIEVQLEFFLIFLYDPVMSQALWVG
jgi:hypothetical protein